MAAQVESSTIKIVTQIFETFSKQAAGAEIPFKTIVVSLLVFGMQQFFSEVVFSCPEKYYMGYGILYIVGPFIILFCVSILVSESFWALTTGCCRVPCQRQRVIWVKASGSLFLATIPPLLWLVFAFADMDFYVCAKLGSEAIALENKNSSQQAKILKKFNQAKTDSQIIAWVLFISFTMFFTIVVSLRRFWKINGKLQGEEDFEKFEAEEVVMYFNSKLKPLAQQGAKQLVDDLFEKYKDHDVVSRVHMCEVSLHDLYPHHSGVVAGKYRKSGVLKPALTTSVQSHNGDPEAVPLQPMV